MTENNHQVPRVFVSYSHDSPEHKRWVGELAAKLRENGIDVILDQWDLGLGDDIPKFMEQSVTEADRVLMICTDKYVHKANEGTGGVGYEAMIVTGELVQDLGTSKFIPVIRQGSAEPLVPKSVGTRLYVNLSHAENYQDQFNQLLRELHNAPRIPKPPLGQSPFPKGSLPGPGGIEAPAPVNLSARSTNANVAYSAALDIIRCDDMVAWRTLVRDARKPIPEELAKWRGKFEGHGLASRREGDRSNLLEILKDAAAEGIVIYAPLLGVAMAGIVSCKQKFNNQIAVLDEILYPRNWNRSGLTDIVGLPETVAFVYQSLHGATCLSTEQLTIAARLARERVGEGPAGKGSVALYKTSEIIGWPATLGGNSKIAWEFLWELPERWPWLNEVFGDPDDYRVALCAYYMSLNIIELVDCVSDKQTGILDQADLRLEVPIRTPLMPREIVRRAYRLLLANPDQVRDLWRSRKVTQDEIQLVWPKWISHTKRTLLREHPYANLHMAQEHLLDDLR